MELADFVSALLRSGQVTVADQIGPFQEEDLRETALVLHRCYEEDVLDMPLTAPPFVPEAALWGAKYLYVAIQLTLLRDLDEEAVKAHLTDFIGPINPSTIYSIDLTIRHLPHLLHLAKGLAPDDVLVKCLQQTLRQWPFSSVGADLSGAFDHGVVLAHASLRTAYLDRIIQHRDQTRIHDEKIAELVREALGAYAEVLWPDFILFTNNHS